MSTDPGPIWIACNLKSEPRSGTAYGSTRCEVCNVKVWIAPASIAVKKDKRYALVVIACIKCWREAYFAKVAAEPGTRPELATTDQQEIEMFTATGQTMTEMYQATFGITPRRLK